VVAELKLGPIGPVFSQFSLDRDTQFLEVVDLLDQVAAPCNQLIAGTLIGFAGPLQTAADAVHAAQKGTQLVVDPRRPLGQLGVAELKLGPIGPVFSQFSLDRDTQFLEVVDLLDQVAAPCNQLIAGTLIGFAGPLQTAADAVHAAQKGTQLVVDPRRPPGQLGGMPVLVLETPQLAHDIQTGQQGGGRGNQHVLFDGTL